MSGDATELAAKGLTGAEVLGRGGFATVYGAFDQRVGRAVAVKVLNASSTDGETARRFDRECEAIGRLADEPTIVPVYDVGRLADGRSFLVMARIDGGSLHEHVLRHGPVPWPVAVALGCTLADALESAHRVGVVHCDVKPANVLLNPDVDHPQLADFGIASLAASDEATMTQSSAGTPCYLPPEALDGERPEPRRDVYSLAATLQFALTGGLPFESADGGIFALMKRIGTEPPADLRPLGVPDAVARAIERAMSKTPEQRPASASAFAEELRAAATATTIEPARPSRRPRVRGVAALAGAAAVTITLVGAIASFRPDGNSSSTSPSSVPNRVPGDARLAAPTGLAVAADGTLYVADTENHRIRRVAVDGTLSTVAGTGRPGRAGDGGPATAAELSSPRGVAVAPDGSLYVADTLNHRIRRIALDGTITTVVGTGDGPGFTSDEATGPRTQLSFPEDVAVAPDGTLYIAESTRVRKYTTIDGIARTVAGNGQFASTGDGGPATAASLGRVVGIDVAPDGSVVFVDADSGRVRRIDQGIITTVAGTGECCGSGDGGPADRASIWVPRGVSVGPDGSIYVAEVGSNVVRRIRPDGVIVGFAGTGTAGLAGDGGPASLADFNAAGGVAVGPNGVVYIADTGNNRVRTVAVDGTVQPLAGG